ncbi:hypothetical protein [Corynebacterium sp.]|uniref:hypothetical protein n=1 Tax=Corynebacterium sp. TaxID=1720 RepID=UPI0026DB9792|nr:hypothetical protein [Corynebacterium sp.]MDO5032036.1 hypothetical protein [Corynebacterium sp.]
MSEPVIRTDTSRGEKIVGLVWLSFGAVFSLILEVVYLTAYLPWCGGAAIPFPITIVVAWWFNSVLTRTARLWSEKTYIAAIPGVVWLVGFCVFALAGAATHSQLLANNVLALLLLIAGIVGSVSPFLKQ